MSSLDADPEFEIVTDPGRFLELEAEWNGLWARSPGHRFTQSFAWRNIGWKTTGLPRGRRLHVLVMRVNGETVLIWPMTVRRRLFLWRVATALGPEFTDYDPVLAAPGLYAAQHLDAAWRFLRLRHDADVITAPFVRQDSAEHGVLSSEPASLSTETLPSPFVAWTGFGCWEDYWRTRSKNTRSGASRRMRHFAELGHVSFTVVEDHQEYRHLLEWSLEQKLARMARIGLDNDFMAKPEFHDFLEALGVTPCLGGRWVMFALKLDGRTVATKMGALDDERYEGFIAAQDPEFANYSVGSIILIKTLEWLFHQGLAYDFRIGAEPYKREWATGNCPTTTYHLANGRWGSVYLAITRWLAAARTAKDRLRHSLPADLRRRVKAWVLSPLSRARRPVGFAVAAPENVSS